MKLNEENLRALMVRANKRYPRWKAIVDPKGYQGLEIAFDDVGDPYFQGQEDPHCSCCRWEYHIDQTFGWDLIFCSDEDFEETLNRAKKELEDAAAKYIEAKRLREIAENEQKAKDKEEFERKELARLTEKYGTAKQFEDIE